MLMNNMVKDIEDHHQECINEIMDHCQVLLWDIPQVILVIIIKWDSIHPSNFHQEDIQLIQLLHKDILLIQLDNILLIQWGNIQLIL